MGSVLPAGVGFACSYVFCYSSWCRFCLCLFFLLLWVALVPIGSANVAGEGCSHGGCSSSNWCRSCLFLEGLLTLWGMVGQRDVGGFSGFGQQSGFYRLQCPMRGGSSGVACPQYSYLLADCNSIFFITIYFFLFQICQLILEYHSYIFSSLLFPLKIFIWILIHFKNLTCFVYEYQSWNVSSVWYFTPISSSCEAFLPLTGAFVSVLLYPRFMLFFFRDQGY